MQFKTPLPISVSSAQGGLSDTRRGLQSGASSRRDALNGGGQDHDSSLRSGSGERDRTEFDEVFDGLAKPETPDRERRAEQDPAEAAVGDEVDNDHSTTSERNGEETMQRTDIPGASLRGESVGQPDNSRASETGRINAGRGENSEDPGSARSDRQGDSVRFETLGRAPNALPVAQSVFSLRTFAESSKIVPAGVQAPAFAGTVISPESADQAVQGDDLPVGRNGTSLASPVAALTQAATSGAASNIPGPGSSEATDGSGRGTSLPADTSVANLAIVGNGSEARSLQVPSAALAAEHSRAGNNPDTSTLVASGQGEGKRQDGLTLAEVRRLEHRRTPPQPGETGRSETNAVIRSADAGKMMNPASGPEVKADESEGLFLQRHSLFETILSDAGAADDFAHLTRGDTVLQPDGRGLQAFAGRAGVVRSIILQMQEALPSAKQHPVEIALNPQELGNVKMALQMSETSIGISIVAERPETLDLLRRHIDQLTEEFRALGYEDIDLNLSDGQFSGQDFADRDGSGTKGSGALADAPDIETPVKRPTPAPGSGVDLRV